MPVGYYPLPVSKHGMYGTSVLYNMPWGMRLCAQYECTAVGPRCWLLAPCAVSEYRPMYTLWYVRDMLGRLRVSIDGALPSGTRNSVLFMQREVVNVPPPSECQSPRHEGLLSSGRETCVLFIQRGAVARPRPSECQCECQC